MNSYDVAELAQTLFEEAGDALFLFDPESEKIFDTNPMAQRLTGWTRRELLTMRISHLFRSEVQGGMVRLRNAFRKTGLFHSQEGFYLRQNLDGRWLPVNLTITRLHTEPETLGLITARDMTEQREAQARLREKEAELRRVLSSVSDCLWSAEVDAKGRWRLGYCSPVIEKITGHQPEYFHGPFDKWRPLLHTEDLPRLLEAFARLRDGAPSLESDFRIVLADGNVRWVRGAVQSRRGADNQLRFDGVLTDITERKLAQQALHRSQRLLQDQFAQLQSYFHNTPIALGMLDCDLRYVLVNERLAELNDLPAAEHRGKHVREVLPPDMAALAEPMLRAVIETGVPIVDRDFRAPMLSQPREIRDWLVSFHPNCTTEGAVIGVYAVILDVTERKRAAQRLERNEKVYRDLVETSNDLIWSVDPVGRWTFVNRKAALAIYGHEPEEMLGRPFIEFTDPTRVDRDLETFAKIKAGQPHFQYETVHIRKDGTPIAMSFNAIVIRDERGESMGTTGTATDITQRKYAERALRESEERFQAFMRNSPAIAFMKDAGGRLVYINHAFERAFRKDGAELLGKNDFELWPAEVAAQLRSHDLAILTGAKPRDFLERVPTQDGEMREWYVLKFPFHDDVGHTFLGGMAIDLTDRRQAEEALRRSEQRYRLLFERNLAGVFRTTLDGNLLDCNDSFVRMLGYESRSEILARAASDFYIDPADRDQMLARLREDPLLSNLETRLRRRDGSEIWVLENVSCIEEAGKPTTLEGTIVDISKQRETLDALRSSEARYRCLVDNLEQCVFLKDRELRFEAVNRHFCNVLARTEQEILGKTDYDFYPAELADKYRTDDLLVLAEGRIVHTEEQNLQDGKLRTVRVIKTPVRDERGRNVGVLGIFWDVTEQVELEEQLRHAQKMEAVGQLAGGIAHDFNNLLTVILGNLSYVLHRPNPRVEASLELLRHAEEAGLRAAELTQRLLGFSRRGVMRSQPFHLNHAVDETVRFLRRTIDPRIQVVTETPESLWLVQADPGMINQMLMNLALNARDAMPEGGRLRLETGNFVPDDDYLRLHLEARPGAFVRLRVQDTGTGIAPENRQRIFEPFFTTKEVGKGTGLGLAMVFGIVKQHQGWITCDSEPGHGATFDVFLPRWQGEAVPDAPAKRDDIPAGTETILVVDDEAMIRNLASLILRRCGYEVLVAEDGQEALEIFRDRGKDIDLILLDGTMPRLSGWDTLRELGRLRPQPPVLFTTGYSTDHHDLASFPQIAGFLQKPYRVEDLARKVRDILDKKLEIPK